ncbi:MAG TPA: hypothetical protein VFN52_00680 [Acidiferrobacteraceae bacterium]|nr:hypothetical protein [Acidiferrobacteraceae bacterium]
MAVGDAPVAVTHTWPLLQAARVAGTAQLGQAETTRLLAQLDHVLDGLAAALKVEYFGPEVGVGDGRAVYRLVVREHALGPAERQWGLRICTALPHAQWRADWALAASGRQRRAAIVAALPAFFVGYWQAVQQAGRAESRAGRRLYELALSFGLEQPCP